MIGRHFLVWSESTKKLEDIAKRQYTIANCMREPVYKAYLQAMEKSLSGDANITPLSLEDKDCDEICITLKNYK